MTQPDLFQYATEKQYGKPGLYASGAMVDRISESTDSIANQYAEWSKLKGARHVKKHFYATTAAFVAEWKRTGVQVSSRLIAELVRHQLKHRLTRAERMDIKTSKWDGYSLNNILTPTLARRVMEEKPDWADIFETRG